MKKRCAGWLTKLALGSSLGERMLGRRTARGGPFLCIGSWTARRSVLGVSPASGRGAGNEGNGGAVALICWMFAFESWPARRWPAR